MSKANDPSKPPPKKPVCRNLGCNRPSDGRHTLCEKCQFTCQRLVKWGDRDVITYVYVDKDQP